MTKTYILQKDIPEGKTPAGTEYINDGNVAVYYPTNIKKEEVTIWQLMPANVVENNPDWFKLKEEKITIKGLITIDNYPHYKYQFRSSQPIDLVRYKNRIENAIAHIANDYHFDTEIPWEKAMSTLMKSGYMVLSNYEYTNYALAMKTLKEYKYTQEDLNKIRVDIIRQFGNYKDMVKPFVMATLLSIIKNEFEK